MDTEPDIFATVFKRDIQILRLGGWEDGCHRKEPNYKKYVFVCLSNFILAFLSYKIAFSTVN